MKDRKIIKRGTDEWWIWVGMLQVAKDERKRLHLSSESEVTINVDRVNEYLHGLNFVKRLWLFLTIGNLRPMDRDTLGKEVTIAAENGVVHHFFK
jgi:hypothetical protein